MQTIRNILKIGSSGAVLSDEYGSTTGIALEFTLGTALKLEFDLRQELASGSGILAAYPADKLISGAYYCALDLNCNYSDSPLLLQISGITLTGDSDGQKTVFAVEIPDTAVARMVAALAGKSSCRMLCEIGGLDSNATAVFAWHFEVTVHNRVFAGTGTPESAGDPEYYTAVQVEAAISRKLCFEYSADGQHWHSEYLAGDTVMRVRHGENGFPSDALALPSGPPGEKGEPGIGAVMEDVVIYENEDADYSFSVEGGHRYILDGEVVNCVYVYIENSSAESEIWFTSGSDGASFFFPETLGWIGEPSFEAGKSYIINIRNNCAVCAAYTPGATV